MGYRTAFPDFGQLDVTLPAGFTDDSYRNDVCPKFVNDRLGLCIWVDYKNKRDRAEERRDVPRFTLCGYDVDSQQALPSILETDDWNAIVAKVKRAKGYRGNPSGSRAVIAYRVLVRKIGPGFHPDTPPNQYSPPLSPPMQRLLRSVMLEAAKYCDLYDVAFEVLGKPRTNPSRRPLAVCRDCYTPICRTDAAGRVSCHCGWVATDKDRRSHAVRAMQRVRSKWAAKKSRRSSR